MVLETGKTGPLVGSLSDTETRKGREYGTEAGTVG